MAGLNCTWNVCLCYHFSLIMMLNIERIWHFHGFMDRVKLIFNTVFPRLHRICTHSFLMRLLGVYGMYNVHVCASLSFLPLLHYQEACLESGVKFYLLSMSINGEWNEKWLSTSIYNNISANLRTERLVCKHTHTRTHTYSHHTHTYYINITYSIHISLQRIIPLFLTVTAMNML